MVSRVLRPLVAMAWVAGWLAGVGPAAAQDAASPDAEARALFEQGVEALREDRFERAVDLLRRSFEMTERPAIAFNLGLALRGAGDSLGAMEIVEPLMEGRYGTIDPRQSEQVEQLSRELRVYLGRVAVRLPETARAELFINEAPRGELVNGDELTLWVEPGEIRIRATTEDGHTVRETIEVEGAERAQVVLQPPTIIVEEVDRAEDDSGISGWWFVGIGAAVAAAAATVIAVLVLTAPEPTEDPIYGRILTLTP